MYKVTSARNGIQTNLGVCDDTNDLYHTILHDALDLCEYDETKVTLEEVFATVFDSVIKDGFPNKMHLGVATYLIDVE